MIMNEAAVLYGNKGFELRGFMYTVHLFFIPNYQKLIATEKCVFQVFFSSHLTGIIVYVIINDIHHGLNVNTYSSNFPSC